MGKIVLTLLLFAFTLSADQEEKKQQKIPDGPFVDKYGQYLHEDWAGKIKDDTQLAKELEEEQKLLNAYNHDEYLQKQGLDKYGGIKGSGLKATGFFRVEKVKGKWWLVTPEGNPFFSLGICGVKYGAAGAAETPLKNAGKRHLRPNDRKSLFSWLPEKNGPFSEAINEDTVNFNLINVIRKYGKEYKDPWSDLTIRRLQSWSFNSLASWCSDTLFEKQKIPYTVYTLAVNPRYGYGYPLIKGVADPFDKRYPEAIKKEFKDNNFSRFKDDPWMIGYFVENEIEWGPKKGKEAEGDFADHVMKQKEKSPAKEALVEYLKKIYGDISAFNTAWNAKLSSFDDLYSSPVDPQNKKAEEDMRGYRKLYADQFYRITTQTIKEIDPNHLFLGSRFLIDRTPKEVEDASAKYLDVVSYNVYFQTIPDNLNERFKRIDKPIIIGEFNFRIPHFRGHGMVQKGFEITYVKSIADRGKAYTQYVTHAAQLPHVVGVHWFKYFDHPVTARLDGSDSNIGFVNVVDQPYKELVDAARQINQKIYEIRK